MNGSFESPCDVRWLSTAGLVVGLACFSHSIRTVRAEEPQSPGIYAMGVDGANFRLLVKLDGMWNGSPSFSPDGKILFFDASPVGGNFEQAHMYSLHADGTGEKKDLGLGNTPSVSPDGKHLTFFVYAGNPNGDDSGVWTMNADGKGRQWLFFGRGPQWSPDGKYLAYINNPNSDGYGPYLYDVEKTESRGLLDRTYRRINGLAWSPDGKRLAFIGQAGGAPELVILPISGDDRNGRVRLTGPIGWRPSWSADGKYVVCWINPTGSRTQLHRVEVDSDREPELLPNQDAGRLNSDASCSADGKQIVFMSDR